jgi:hypothetical protein
VGMPLTPILLTIFIVSAITATAGFVKKIIILKLIAGVLFFVGISITILLIFGFKNM